MALAECPECLGAISSHADVCPECGTPISFDTALENRAKSRLIACLLALFLGGFGGHKFYLKSYSMGIIYVTMCWTIVPFLLGFIEAFIYASQSNKEFQIQNGI